MKAPKILSLENFLYINFVANSHAHTVVWEKWGTKIFVSSVTQTYEIVLPMNKQKK